MAGDSQTGGGGSVTWYVKVDDVDASPQNTICEDHGRGQFHQRGRDKDNTVTDFKIRILRPKKYADTASYLNDLRNAIRDGGDGRVEFTLPIDKDETDQIRITWGNGTFASRGEKIRQNAHVPAKMVEQRQAGALRQASAPKKGSPKTRTVKKSKTSSRKRKAS